MRIDTPTNLPKSETARKAEDTDTRQALQRHDPEFHKKKKDEGEEQGFKDPYEDLTDVSIPALKNFLMGLIDRMPDSEATATQTDTPAPTDTLRQPANPKAAAAISAYQSGASRGVSSPPPRPAPVAQPTATSALDKAASSLDRAVVLGLIRDLDRLAAAGINAIALEKGEGFLASIRTAIDKARDNLAM